nr:AraC family transcriptional regulator [uncultured Microbacterium sp.]
MAVRDGFPGQRLVVVPRPQVMEALGSPVTDQLTTTDAGYFPQARAHGVTRHHGLRSAIIIVCVEGAGWCEIRGARHDVVSGQVLIVPPGEPHSYGADAEHPWTLWWLHVAGAQLSALLDHGGFTADSPVREVPDLFQAVSLMEEVVGALESDPTTGHRLSVSGATWHLLTTLSATRAAPGSRTEVIERARRQIHDHPAQRFSVADLAGMAGMSGSHFAALFRAQVGAPVLQYQTSVRMAHARGLLDTTSRPVSEVARESGYADPFYFSRQFTAIHGMTPLAYRRNDKG